MNFIIFKNIFFYPGKIALLLNYLKQFKIKKNLNIILK